jgi:hypothetical protein
MMVLGIGIKLSDLYNLKSAEDKNRTKQEKQKKVEKKKNTKLLFLYLSDHLENRLK